MGSDQIGLHLLVSPISSFRRNLALVGQLTRREVLGRYRGSFFGLVWSFFYPLLMLAVYTFVFSVIFNARWGGATDDRAGFAIAVFAGLIIHSLFSECAIRAPTLILGNVNYVKKVVFPLEILPWAVIGSALFHAVVSAIVLLAFFLYINSYLHVTFLLFPIVIIPLIILIAGVSWFLAAIGVYVRDINQIVGVLTTVLLFLSPIFYPQSALPEAFQPYLLFNPLTFIIEQARNVLLWGKWPDWAGLAIYTVFSVIFAQLGFLTFQKLRKGFADVL